MEELHGPNIQIVLHVKEGLGFGFLKNPFVVSGSLNGYMLETDPSVPCHAPVFDAELVWEADKRRFRSLRVQNVPIKVEVYTMGTQGRKDKVGYLLLSLLGAQPCPMNKIVDVKHTWHRLLGIRSEGKCCHPQLLLSLSVEDRVNMLTPRNELRMFHSNEVAFPSTYSSTNPPVVRTVLMTINEYIAESKKTVTCPDLQPKLLCDEGLIQIGDGKQMFVLSFVIGTVENLDLLLRESNSASKEADECYVTYSVFTHDVMTDRVCAKSTGAGISAHFNQRTSLRLRTSLNALGRYFVQCPYLVTKICAADRDIGICSMDLRKIVPTDDLSKFLDTFCNEGKALRIHERCYILPFDGAEMKGRRPYVDVEMNLNYIEELKDGGNKLNILTARSAADLDDRKRAVLEQDSAMLEARSGSCTHLDQDLGGFGYTNMAVTNTSRYRNAAGDALIQTNELTELIKKMYDSFTVSQEKLLSQVRTKTSDMQVQCDEYVKEGGQKGAEDTINHKNGGEKKESVRIQLETSRSDPCLKHNQLKDMVKMTIPASDRDAIMQRFVEELEDWKEKQQELFKCQLKRKEDYHLELLAREWATKRLELESKLSKGIEQCRNLAADLSRATDDFRLRGYRNTEREKKLLEAKKALEAHYTLKYQELREASQKMEDDMNHQIRLKDMRIEELETKVQQLEKQIEDLRTIMKNSEKEAGSRYSGLTKDQTASLIQELRCLEEKLDSAVQSKSFFKEQWGRAVRELHSAKLRARRHVLAQLRRDRTQLAGMHGMGTIDDQDDDLGNDDEMEIKRQKDDFYVDILANTPALESHSIISTGGPDKLEMFDDLKSAPKNPMSEKINELIIQRDKLIQEENPDEDLLRQLNQDIRNMLLNCGN